MPLLLVIVIAVSFVVGLAAPNRRLAALISGAGALVCWSVIARTAFHSPIPLNEPEWWGGLAVVSVAIAMGVIPGTMARRRGV